MPDLPGFSHRLAAADDIPALAPLMARAMAQLLRPHLTPEQVAASPAIMGLDTQLIADRTYFVVEHGGRIAGCGGWSRRATHFGGDHSPGRNAALLDPARDAARVRAMYTDPDFARRGIGRLILELAEERAAAEGFRRLELVATLAGAPLYRTFGFVDGERFEEPTPMGVPVPLIRMSKSIRREAAIL